ncbi:hypothetical protein GCM10027053_46490 [Intrasporangium mesophilum]
MSEPFPHDILEEVCEVFRESARLSRGGSVEQHAAHFERNAALAARLREWEIRRSELRVRRQLDGSPGWEN